MRTLQDGQVIHHQMYACTRVTPRWPAPGLLRQPAFLLASPRIAVSRVRHELRERTPA